MALLLITKYFIFVHYKKTGGTFLRRLFRDHLPADWVVDRQPMHAGWNKIPEQYAHLPAIAFIRNPWDWYVSWYHWENQYLGSGDRPTPEREGHPWATLFGRGEYDFKEAVTRACTRREGGRAWEIAMRAWDVDMLTASHATMTGHYPAPLPPELAHMRPPDRRPVEVARFENLRDELLSFMDRHDVPLPDGFVDAVQSYPPQHASRRSAYVDYYDDELRELVAHNARYVIAAHGYEY
jgi:hypothetical protein